MKSQIIVAIARLVIPLIMIVFGGRFSHHSPQHINYFMGYRTPRSMKNEDTWIFANQYCGRLLWVCGWLLLILSVATLLIGFAFDTARLSFFELGVCGVQILFILLVFIKTEMALHKNFDEEGNRKS